MIKTATERLQFVIRFAQMDLESLRPGDLLNLRDDLSQFLALPGTEAEGFVLTDVGRINGVVNKPPFPDQFPEWAFRKLQTKINATLHPLLDDRNDEHTGMESPRLDIHIAAVLHSTGPLAQPPGFNVLAILGTTEDVFLFILLDLLVHERSDQILRCPECRRIFYRVGKQLYCSRTCSNRASVRTWRQREEVKHAEAEHAHTRYATKKKSEIGPGTTVKRRPRKRSPATS